VKEPASLGNSLPERRSGPFETVIVVDDVVPIHQNAVARIEALAAPWTNIVHTVTMSYLFILDGVVSA